MSPTPFPSSRQSWQSSAAIFVTSGAAQAVSCATGFPTVTPPSCFEAGDGNTAAGVGKTDWANHGNVVTFKDDTRDTQFSGGDKENDPGAWDIVPHTGDPRFRPSARTRTTCSRARSPVSWCPTSTRRRTTTSSCTARSSARRRPATPRPRSSSTSSPEARCRDAAVAAEPQRGRPLHHLRRRPRLRRRPHVRLARRRRGRDDQRRLRLVLAARLRPARLREARGRGQLHPPGRRRGRQQGDRQGERRDLGTGRAADPDFGASLGIGSFGEISVDLTRALDKLASAGTADKCFGFGAMALHTRSSDAGTASPQGLRRAGRDPEAHELRPRAREEGRARRRRGADVRERRHGRDGRGGAHGRRPPVPLRGQEPLGLPVPAGVDRAHRADDGRL